MKMTTMMKTKKKARMIKTDERWWKLMKIDEHDEIHEMTTNHDNDETYECWTRRKSWKL